MARRVLIVGGGHNGLVCAAYLARAGAKVTVLERRSVLGGACVTEELWPGYRISRAAYVISLLRPRIVRELELARHGLVLLPRSPSSITPLDDGRSLVLGPDASENASEISKFSQRDAVAYPRYEALLERLARAIEPTLDLPPPGPLRRARDLAPWWAALRAAGRMARDFPAAARTLLAPARDLLTEWFDSEPLRATLATDATIGAFASPSTPGTGYVLLHHVMGDLGGQRGVWAYVQGGMGALTRALARAAESAGARLCTDAGVAKLQVIGDRVGGAVLANGDEYTADIVVSSCDLARTLRWLPDAAGLPHEFTRAARQLDYRSPVFKVNLALRSVPKLRITDRDPFPLCGTIHIGSPDLDAIERAYIEALAGHVPERPVIELTLPSVVDPTLAPDGHCVASIFAQYAPVLPRDDLRWPDIRKALRDRVLTLVDEVAPGFSDSIVNDEVLAPPDLEELFGLTGGNIFQGAMTPDRLYALRPVSGFARYRTPLAGLYLCGATCHPGGGVMGACGRNAALEILADLRLH
jgi:phytoene dehydrogenase-like protein